MTSKKLKACGKIECETPEGKKAELTLPSKKKKEEKMKLSISTRGMVLNTLT